MSDVAVKEDVRARVLGRIEELQPLVEEYEDLRRIAAAIETEAAARSAEEASRSRRAGSRRAVRAGRNGHGARSDQARTLIGEQPGVTVAELADTMGIGTTYLYRLLPRLEREGVLRKQGQGYHLADG